MPEQGSSLSNQINCLDLSAVQYEYFGKHFLNNYFESGVNAISKKEIEILILESLIKSNVITYEEDIKLSTAKQFKITPEKLSSMLLDAYLKYGKLEESPITDDILSKCYRASKKDIELGYFVFYTNNQVRRAQIIDFFEKKNIAPDFSYSKSIIKISIDSIIASDSNFIYKFASTISEAINRPELMKYIDGCNPKKTWDKTRDFIKENWQELSNLAQLGIAISQPFFK